MDVVPVCELIKGPYKAVEKLIKIQNSGEGFETKIYNLMSDNI